MYIMLIVISISMCMYICKYIYVCVYVYVYIYGPASARPPSPQGWVFSLASYCLPPLWPVVVGCLGCC